MVPPEIYEKYAEQIKIAKKILDTIHYVQDNGGNYFEIISEYLDGHESNMMKMVTKVMDLYFDNETFIADAFINLVEG